MIVHKHKRVDSAPFYYGRQNAQHIAAASIHSYYKYTQNSGELQWGDGFFLFRGPCFNTEFPRSRGKYFLQSPKPLLLLGSPPLTRGIPFPRNKIHAVHGITPAYAGNTWITMILNLIVRDHPRLRGEYNICLENI